MRERLIQYVDLLFAGAPHEDEMRLEILQNTLDRYDDLIASGKTPEAAYRLSISGIGDIHEILGSGTGEAVCYGTSQVPKKERSYRKILRAVAIGLYILCPVPLFVLSDMGMDTAGLCGLLGMVAVATVLIILSKNDPDTPVTSGEIKTRSGAPKRKIRYGLLWAGGIWAYLILSLLTGAWIITLLIIPITAVLHGIIDAVDDLKEC